MLDLIILALFLLPWVFLVLVLIYGARHRHDVVTPPMSGSSEWSDILHRGA